MLSSILYICFVTSLLCNALFVLQYGMENVAAGVLYCMPGASPLMWLSRMEMRSANETDAVKNPTLGETFQYMPNTQVRCL